VPAANIQHRKSNNVELPIHCRPDSERLLRAHNAWVAEWDASAQEEEAPDFDALVKEAFTLYARGMMPIQVRWRLAEAHSSLPARVLSRAQRHAEKALCAAESAPPELRRAMVAAARQEVIQGALAAGDWGAALRGLDRAGEIAGELRESAGLTEEDLILTVQVEEAPELPGGDSQPVSAENEHDLTAETVETED
jgi:hypothetical protein